MLALFQTVPNFSEGRDPAVVSDLVDAMSSQGGELLDWSADPDHHRAVLTYVGDGDTVLRAAIAAAKVALDRIDLRVHKGVHPRVGALDVLPFVPLFGASKADAVELALRAADELAGLGLPTYLYGWAANGPARSLSRLRNGGFEALVDGYPEGREPDRIPKGWPHRGAHPTAGVTCVGARPVLLAWNVYVEGLENRDLREIAAAIRERGGGFSGLRALGLVLPRRERMQISMNLEDLRRTSPFEVFEEIERMVAKRAGRVTETEVIGMAPDELVLPAATDRLALRGLEPGRLLSARLGRFVASREQSGPTL